MSENCNDDISWSREQNKAFEDAIATYHNGDGDDEIWGKIASAVPGGKSIEEIKHHYEALVYDVSRIESGFVPLPSYCFDETGNSDPTGNALVEPKGSTKLSRLEKERRKGIPWSEEEHRLFLLGLEKYGKGDWRSISRNFVVTRTPTQVASHAQKYFIRLNSMNKERRRTSIHDITSVVIKNEKDGVSPP